MSECRTEEPGFCRTTPGVDGGVGAPGARVRTTEATEPGPESLRAVRGSGRAQRAHLGQEVPGTLLENQ